MSRRAIGLVLTLLLTLLIAVPAASARVGGGQSYGGSGGGGGGDWGGGGSSGDGVEVAWLIYWLIRGLIELNLYYPLVGVPVDVVVVLVVVWLVASAANAQALPAPRGQPLAGGAVALGHGLAAGEDRTRRFVALREFDPNFSEVLFLDFVTALYARVQDARGRHDLATLSPFLAADVAAQLNELGGRGLMGVTGVIVGAAHVAAVSTPQKPIIRLAVELEANYTERHGETDQGMAYYVRERWTFERRRDVLSRPPEKITALHCPKCGSALEQAPDGSCRHCGVKIVGGDFDWFLEEVDLLSRSSRGPLLTSDVPEQGTDLPTVYQPDLAAARRRFQTLNPEFNWPRTETRFQHMFLELQAAWSDLKWERARPYETDNLFQSHLYWITEYQRQRLRNVLDQVQIDSMELVKLTPDPFYDGITVRIFARMIDCTIDEQGKVVAGNRNEVRAFSEYWTFVRRRGVKESGREPTQCPNCGAPLKINMAGVCDYCHGKITSGDFDWVASRIEQDEAYQG